MSVTVPRATYRLQLRPGMGFGEAAELVPYFASLGVSHLYLSPVLRAAPGSPHGYDVVDPTRVNEEIGGEEGFRALADAVSRAGLGLVLDVVPNHMAATAENAWWWDLLENGPAGRYADHFDVEWDPPEAKLRDRILLPILPDHYGRVLEAGGIRIEHDGGRLTVRTGDDVLPLAPRSLPLVLEAAARRAGSDELAFVASALARLPSPADREPRERARRHRDLQVLKRHLLRLCAAGSDVERAIALEVEALNADPDALDVLLDMQSYRLAFWRTADRELAYRRFFDIDRLIALRTERPEVFDELHSLPLRWVEEGRIAGLRVDHPDGLREPRAYFGRLREKAPGAWIVAEKILEGEEDLRADWPVDGTTGYDFLADVGALLVDPEGEEPLTRLYAELTGEETAFAEVAYRRKLQVLRESLAADVLRLADWAVAICEGRRRYRDYTRHDLHEALVEVAASFPVYRSYVEEDGRAEAGDREAIGTGVRRAGERRPDLEPDLLRFLERILLADPELRGPEERELRMRFQQLTPPAMAKGVEDTALYVHNRFVALNEVGGDPGRFGLPPEAFHRRNLRARERWPRTMLALSTHDTKRSEDVRARLALLSEIPDAWAAAVRRWMEIADRHRTGPELPDRNLEYLLHQTVVGAHPLPLERLQAYAEKASREANTHTSWTRPDPAYDEALRASVAGLHADPEYRSEVEGFVAGLVAPGRVNALAQKLLQLTAPGVPDVYRGSELWDLSLVDPDNRRPVDWAARRRLLAVLEEEPPVECVTPRDDEGLPKLHVVRQALHLRRERPQALGPEGSYEPLEVRGPAARHAVAFVRGGAVVAVAPRLPLRLAADGGWRDTVVALPAGGWLERLTATEVEGGDVPLGALLERFPVALLERPR